MGTALNLVPELSASFASPILLLCVILSPPAASTQSLLPQTCISSCLQILRDPPALQRECGLSQPGLTPSRAGSESISPNSLQALKDEICVSLLASVSLAPGTAPRRGQDLKQCGQTQFYSSKSLWGNIQTSTFVLAHSLSHSPLSKLTVSFMAAI